MASSEKVSMAPSRMDPENSLVLEPNSITCGSLDSVLCKPHRRRRALSGFEKIERKLKGRIEEAKGTLCLR